MILCWRSNYKIILTSSSHGKSESSLILGLILFRLSFLCKKSHSKLMKLIRQFMAGALKLSSLRPRSAGNTQHSLSKMSQVLSSGRRKYSAILETLVEKALCRVKCTHLDTRTIIDGVKKEKVKWVKRKRWPSGKALKIDIEDDGILFKSILDTSINNL
jgi:hypothetical protein